MRFYGSLNNRLEENKIYCDEIKVGTGMTVYLYSDRHAYEVIAVKDQKHVTVRLYDHKAVGEPMSNTWELISNPDNPTMDMVRRGKYWYRVNTITKEEYEKNKENFDFRIWMCQNAFDPNVISKKGKQTKYHRMNVSFGTASYYYDYSF